MSDLKTTVQASEEGPLEDRLRTVARLIPGGFVPGAPPSPARSDE